MIPRINSPLNNLKVFSLVPGHCGSTEWTNILRDINLRVAMFDNSPPIRTPRTDVLHAAEIKNGILLINWHWSKADGAIFEVMRRPIFVEKFDIFQFGSSFFAFLLVAGSVRLLAFNTAIFDEMTCVAFLQLDITVIATLSTVGTCV